MMSFNKVTAVVLSGGGSTRMGRNKALLKLGNKTMIERVVNPLQRIFDDILVVTNEPESYHMLEGIKFTPDCVDIGKKSSLIGLYSGLKRSENPHIFAIGCDMPFVNIELIRYMVNSLKNGDSNGDTLVPFVDTDLVEHIIELSKDKNSAVLSANRHYQPLHAIYSKSCIPKIEGMLEEGNYKVTNIFRITNTKKIFENDIIRFDPNMLCFKNVNTYEEY
ncbi:MAG TPA: molybdenum cofactor guanylyltransferase, partial [Oscillospiraceae bacterium]|nr:molybdenum cofactor guanylyltransferase [Oscillospiraceae bacterium]